MTSPMNRAAFRAVVEEAAKTTGLADGATEARNACRLVAATMFARGSTDLPYGATGVFADVLAALTGKRPTGQSMRWYVMKVRNDWVEVAGAFGFPPEWSELLVCEATPA